MAMSMEPHEGSGVSRDPSSNDVLSSEREERAAKWREKTSATLIDEGELIALKEREGLHIVGVTGFSGQWSEAKINEDPKIASDVSDATVAIKDYLLALKAKYGDKLLLSSGATMEGVPKLIYDECERLGISAMGVTSEKAFDYPLGKMLFLVVEGKDWGEESATFLRTSDELLLIGGGGQAKREALAASSEGKALTVFQGFGGSADALTVGDVPGAVFVTR